MSNRICPQCGEEYSDTYRRCPFCEEEAAEERGKPLHRGGHRLEKKQRSAGAGGVMLLLTVVIIAGVLVYVFFGDRIADFMGIRTGEIDGIGDGGSSYVDPDANPGSQTDILNGSQTGDTLSTPNDTQSGGENEPPEAAGPLTLASPDKFTIPAGETGRITVTGGTGDITWTSSNAEIASVEDGAVTGVAGGVVTITAQAGEESVSCEVTVTGDPWVSPVELRLSSTDFTISQKNPDPVRLKVKGGEYTSISWSSSNTSVATVSGDGVVTRVGKGTATITCVVDGQTLTCIARCAY